MQEDRFCGNGTNAQYAFPVIQHVIFLPLRMPLDKYSLKYK